MSTEDQWKRCSACKEPIAFGAEYWACNVSTCNRKRTALAFCTVSCWEVHLPIANHREAWAEERRAPSRAQAQAEEAAASTPKPPKREPQRRLVRPAAKEASPMPEAAGSAPEEVLIIASRLKEYVRARSGYNTSDRILGPLSDLVRRACDEAIERATEDGRKTILDRDLRSR